MNENVTLLREVLDNLRGEAGRLERMGRALTDAESRRLGTLREAEQLVRRALDLLDPAERVGPVPNPDDTERGSGFADDASIGLAGDEDFERDRGEFGGAHA